MSEQEQEAPVWHSIVGEGYEPVLIGERTADNEDELLARGWVEQQNSGGFIYSGGMRPRRRRKRKRFPVTITINGERDGVIKKLYCQFLDAQTGDRFEVGPDGSLVRVLNSL
jgi:hypothetical protein